MTVVDFDDSSKDYTIFYEDEEIIVRGKSRIVRRLYVVDNSIGRDNDDTGASTRDGKSFDSFESSDSNVDSKDLENDTETTAQAFRSNGTENFEGVGWIINEDINDCMVCGESFGTFRWPHHCR